jgi:photosystem I P700 chlorophyll a apoprotein A2
LCAVFQSLWLTDIAHHHLAIAVLFIIAGHMYRTNFGIGHSMKEILEAHRPPGGRLEKDIGLYETVTILHMQLGLALALHPLVYISQHIYALNPYAFLSRDYATEAALYTHHQYIAVFNG